MANPRLQHEKKRFEICRAFVVDHRCLECVYVCFLAFSRHTESEPASNWRSYNLYSLLLPPAFPDADFDQDPRKRSAGFPPVECEDAFGNDRDHRCAHGSPAVALPHGQVSYSHDTVPTRYEFFGFGHLGGHFPHSRDVFRVSRIRGQSRTWRFSISFRGRYIMCRFLLHSFILRATQRRCICFLRGIVYIVYVRWTYRQRRGLFRRVPCKHTLLFSLNRAELLATRRLAVLICTYIRVPRGSNRGRPPMPHSASSV